MFRTLDDLYAIQPYTPLTKDSYLGVQALGHELPYRPLLAATDVIYVDEALPKQGALAGSEQELVAA